ncbi:MAG: V-type ATP synthase subunit A, partial [Lentisphaerae bacterium]|nr:V-type ATP synthase subunit A [Lentisphaerota bacterium]
MTTKGIITGVNGNLITVKFDGAVALNEVGYIKLGDLSLMSEIVRIRGSNADMQVFEDTSDIAAGSEVEFTGELLSAELGPGLLKQIFDGLQNPLPGLAEEFGFFLQRGKYIKALPRDVEWDFTPKAKVGDVLVAGDTLGTVHEVMFEHRIMVPFILNGRQTVKSIVSAGSFTVDNTVAVLVDEAGNETEVSMVQRWPVKVPITCYAERLSPEETMVTQSRTIDTFFPVALGGTYCIPGPFGAGKTVLQQSMSRLAQVDIVIYAACGER